jgi:hypothetical protein
MKEKNENRLDQLFKDGLSGSEDHFAFREEDWESMEQLLDKKPGKKAGLFRIIYYASGIAALLLLAAGLYFYTNTDKTDPLITKNTKIQAQADSGQTSIRQAEKPAVPVESLSATAPKKTAPTQTVITPVVSNPLNPALARVQHGRKTIDDTIYANPQRLASTNHVRLNTRKKDTIDHNNQRNIATTTAVQKVNTPNKDTIYNAAGNFALNPGKKTKVAGTDTIYNNNLAATQNQKGSAAVTRDTIYDKIKANEEQQRIAVKRDAIKYRPQFSISVLAASDANGVNSFGRSQTGTNFGFQFSARLTKKLTVSTGAAYAIKPYSSNLAGYNPAYAPPLSTTNIQANCKVLDIPLNLNYQLYSKGNNTLSLGSGLSSYFMLKEDYRYDYTAESGLSPKYIEIKNKNTHLFGVVNIDVNYQRRINSKFSAVIQPYMKLPITGIGNGNVNLKSTGVALGVNWNLGRR